jgi:hypothetical protein
VAEKGGEETFADLRANGEVAPIPVVRLTTVGPLKSIPQLPFGHSACAYSIASSARCRIDCGTVRLSALAVLRLMISEYFVGCWTGRSAGWRP